jgi:hypothetical protein
MYISILPGSVGANGVPAKVSEPRMCMGFPQGLRCMLKNFKTKRMENARRCKSDCTNPTRSGRAVAIPEVCIQAAIRQ